MAKPLISLNVQHEYITLRAPNGNFTMSWGGARASGGLAKDDKAFRAIDAHVVAQQKAGVANGDTMKALTDPKLLATLWPSWNVVPVIEDLVPGDRVEFRDAFFKKRYPATYEVESLRPKTAFLKLADGICGFSRTELKKALTLQPVSAQ